jgi:hypothetical protein
MPRGQPQISLLAGLVLTWLGLASSAQVSAGRWELIDYDREHTSGKSQIALWLLAGMRIKTQRRRTLTMPRACRCSVFNVWTAGPSFSLISISRCSPDRLQSPTASRRERPSTPRGRVKGLRWRP